LHQAPFAGGVEPEEEAPLRVRELGPEGRDAPEWRAVGRLDQHDVGAEAGEQLSRERALLVAEVEHAKTRERAAHSRMKRSRAASSVSVETAVTRSESSRSVSTALGPTSISTE